MVYIINREDYILLLNTTLSEKSTLPATKPTIAIIGRLIVEPAMPVDIPVNADRPKDSKIATAAYRRDKCHIILTLDTQCRREHPADSL